MKILGQQNTPCGVYDDDRDILCDAITCKRITLPRDGGVMHLHRYFKLHPLRSKRCESPSWVFIKLGWSAKVRGR